MSLATDVVRENHLDLYQELDRIGQGAERVVQEYMDKAMALYLAVPLADDKADVVAHRDALKVSLQAILNNN